MAATRPAGARKCPGRAQAQGETLPADAAQVKETARSRRLTGSIGEEGRRLEPDTPCATVRQDRRVERWRRPTREEQLAAYGVTLPDLVGQGMRVLLCGINPGLMSGAIGHHFGNPANRLWPALHLAGFTPRRLHPLESHELLACGVGITNLVARATATAAELSAAEIRAGVAPLTALVAEWEPRYVAFLGLTSYRTAFGRKDAVVGEQPERLAGAGIWLLPNTSGLNAHYQAAGFAAAFAELRRAVQARPRTGGARPARRS